MEFVSELVVLSWSPICTHTRWPFVTQWAAVTMYLMMTYHHFIYWHRLQSQNILNDKYKLVWDYRPSTKIGSWLLLQGNWGWFKISLHLLGLFKWLTFEYLFLWVFSNIWRYFIKEPAHGWEPREASSPFTTLCLSKCYHHSCCFHVKIHHPVFIIRLFSFSFDRSLLHFVEPTLLLLDSALTQLTQLMKRKQPMQLNTTHAIYATHPWQCNKSAHVNSIFKQCTHIHRCFPNSSPAQMDHFWAPMHCNGTTGNDQIQHLLFSKLPTIRHASWAWGPRHTRSFRQTLASSEGAPCSSASSSFSSSFSSFSSSFFFLLQS